MTSSPMSNERRATTAWSTVWSNEVHALTSPPAASTAPVSSPTPRRAVPLNSMCSTRWATPSWPGGSSADPTPTQAWSATTGASRCGASTTVRPLSSRYVWTSGTGGACARADPGASAATTQVTAPTRS